MSAGPQKELTCWNRSKMHENNGRNGPRPNRTGNDIEYLISCDCFVENVYLFITLQKMVKLNVCWAPTRN